MNNDKIETCGKRIEKALRIRHMKQADLCKLANVPKSSLSLYLKGAYEPKQDKVYKMASVLNVSEVWLMGYDVPMETEGITPTKTRELTDNEEVMLDLFRNIPESQQKVIIQMIRGGLDTQR